MLCDVAAHDGTTSLAERSVTRTSVFALRSGARGGSSLVTVSVIKTCRAGGIASPLSAVWKNGARDVGARQTSLSERVVIVSSPVATRQTSRQAKFKLDKH